ncbi:dTDP-4-dehydrorhamnose 3,5-epimerase [Wenzhouxiangella marina]|uniref:dTDP-4-dehydrorhamnose 3,5-epimerase n=1 Tax=Wenzhouxiangella marina TaxID=1579979 RepID=A0A0K0XXF8_9GAMM|nr:dTDP-4-dehydrorhamnose 3,5-epimerase [Wenzhouxiangella marina]AKS42384.1 dTDP-4-dehydrorhamnose 3,5-epimerase [Wenzhouxiangella marina]MBB6085843.1 dTDP-4-dehydrorhamnose 3,5-epimerase [Wenzhouxiangella marina]
MIVEETTLPGVLEIKPRLFGDERGVFLETWRQERYEAYGIGPRFVQANTSRSGRGVLRGLHYQWPEPQGKLVWVSSGRVLDVAVDIRPDSPHFRQWVACELDAEQLNQLWVPEGFAHGFVVLSETATFNYLCTRPYRGEQDRGIAWNDPDLAVDWRVSTPELSGKDAQAPRLVDIDPQDLPTCASC